MSEKLSSPVSGKEISLKTAFYQIDGRRCGGYVVDLDDLAVRYVVEVLIDGRPAHILRANERVAELVGSAVGDGCYGFSLNLSQDLAHSTTIEARIANTGQPIGSAINLAKRDQDHILEEYLEWHGSLHFSGWSNALAGPGARLRVMVDNVDILDVAAVGWKAFGQSLETATTVPSFDFHLPERFADGIIRSLSIFDQTGRQLAGCPIQFLAYNDRLEAVVAKLSGSEGDLFYSKAVRLRFPQSWPLSRYDEWRERHKQRPILPLNRPIAVVVVGEEGVEDTVSSLEATNDEWVVGNFPTNPEEEGFDLSTLRRFLVREAAQCFTVVFCKSGIKFAPDCLARIDGLFRKTPHALLTYGDLAIQSEGEKSWPIAFPAFDYERFLEQGYLCHLYGTGRVALLDKLPEAGSTDLFQIAFTLIANPAVGMNVFHLPGECGRISKGALASSRLLAGAVTQHLNMRGQSAHVQPKEDQVFPAVKVQRAIRKRSTEIIIPTRNRADLLRRCINSITRGAVKAGASITVIDNDSNMPDAVGYLHSLEEQGIKIIRVPGEFNFSRLNNIAVAKSDAEVVCLLNNDIEALDDDWLSELLGRLSERDVGAVGALLCTPQGIVQHGGVILGPGLAAAHAFTDRLYGDPGYTDLLRVAHECSAVTAACLVTSRKDYEDVNGLDEVRFPVDFNDIDYCLKLRSCGKRIVFSPHARLVHLESASRGNAAGSDLFRRAVVNLRSKWLEVLANDPFYSPTLALDGEPYSGLAWPPRDLSPRLAKSPAPIFVPAGM